MVTWVKTLLSDAFFWTDNDLVVQTRSMYGGSPRERELDVRSRPGRQGLALQLLQQRRRLRRRSSTRWPLSADPPDEFRVDRPALVERDFVDRGSGGAAVASTAAAAAEAASALRPARNTRQQSEDRRRSHLARVAPRQRLRSSSLTIPKGTTTVLPDGPIGIYYDDLATFFFDDHDVKPFAFDWRRPIAAEAKRLADGGRRRPRRAQDVKTAGADHRAFDGRPGCAVMQIVSPQTWNRMMESDGARLLMLGTPNGGSWTPMQVLSGDDTFGNLLVNVGAPFGGNGARSSSPISPGSCSFRPVC